MGDRSAIEWCDSTFNPWTGCTKISPACDHCYAESLSKRAPKSIAQWGAGQTRRRTSAANWRKPLAWNKAAFVQCQGCGWRGAFPGASRCSACESDYYKPARRRVFCASLADVFDNEVDPQWRADMFALIHDTENLDWLLLTKRIGNAESMIKEAILGLRAQGRVIRPWPWPNVWLGATICNQAEANRDIPKLLATPARVRFLSIEPMLGPINFRWQPYAHQAAGESYRAYLDRNGSVNHLESLRGIHWIIAGGESGAHARPSHPDWFRSLRDQCAAACVPFLFKQWGEWLPVDADGDLPTIAQDGSDRPLPGTTPIDTTFGLSNLVGRIGKKAAGRLLDGRTHDGFPLTLQAGGDRGG